MAKSPYNLQEGSTMKHDIADMVMLASAILIGLVGLSALMFWLLS